MKLTDKVVAGLVCTAGRKDETFGDATLKGFWVRVQANGTKTFLFRYKVGEASRRIPLGTFGEVTAVQARKKAEALRGDVRDGRDPWTERKAARASAIAADTEAAFTVSRLLEEFARKHLAGKRESYRRDVLVRLRLHLQPLLDKPAGSITKKQAVARIDVIADASGITTAVRVLQYARTMFSWALKRDAIALNPFLNVPSPGKVKARERTLTLEETGAIWRASFSLGTPHGPYLRFLMLTLARREEVASMTWGEVTPDLTGWTLPTDRSKNHKPHVVPLSGPAQAILRALHHGTADSLVFGVIVPAKEVGQPSSMRKLTTHSYIKRKVDAVMAEEAAKRASGADGVSPPLSHDWTFHDFRRTGVTDLAERMGVPPHIADKLLSHKQGSIRGVMAIYQRGEFLAERARALEAWAAHVLACAEGKPLPSNVVRLAAGG